MSFSTDVKTELASLHHSQCCDKAELSAMFHIGGSIELSSEGMSLSFQTTNGAVTRKITKLIKDLYRIDVEILSKKLTTFQKLDLYIIHVKDKVDFIMNDLSLMNKNALFFQDTDPQLIEKECCKRAYLRGAFLAGGSLNSPETASYHLEIQTSSQIQAEVLSDISKEFLLNAKVTHNKRGFIAYIKEAEKISDFLRAVGATNSLFEFEDSRINRDFKNSINRVINCDIANEKKAIEAANKQLEFIKIIEDHLHDQIPESMKEAIFLRKAYPESTLHELSYASVEYFEDQISKSALNHRFRAIRDLAISLQIQEEMR